MKNNQTEIDFLIEELAKARVIIRKTGEAFQFIEGDAEVRKEFEEGFANGYTLEEAEITIEDFKEGSSAVADRYIREEILSIEHVVKHKFKQ